MINLAFFDHLLRENPSSRFTAIKRSYFNEEGNKGELGNGVEAYKGMYQSIRIAHVSYQLSDMDTPNSLLTYLPAWSSCRQH